MTKVIALIRLRRFISVNLSFLLGLGLILQHGSIKSASAQKPEGFDLYAKTSTIWSSNVIPVCWENPSDNFNTEMNWVRTAAESSWKSVSAVNFVDWGVCNTGSKGIRIQINDEGPHTKGLGSELNGVQNGMVLNFTFQNWSSSCQSDRERCIKLIAVHEFGHSLGFAHEQVRPDTPTNCTEEKQGSQGDILIGPWDLDSVMNYCNPNWNGGGNLSRTDIIGVQRMYGTPFILQTGTALHETGNEFNFAMSDWDRDGKPDLVAIKKSGTGSGKTEVHILSGASNFSQFILQTGTALHETGDNFTFQLGDWNRDGQPDLIAIKKNQTGTRSTELHILSGASNFGKFILQTGTALHETSSNFEFVSNDWNQDGFADLIAIKKSGTDTGKTEVHVVSATTYLK